MSTLRTRVALLAFTAGLCLSSSAAAGPLPGYHLDLTVHTDISLDVGGRLTVEFPHRLRLSTSLGVLPSGYLKLINAVVVAAGGYNDGTARAVETTLKNALIWRTHFGWRPFRKLGFYFEIGYGVSFLGGGADGETLFVLATGVQPPATQGLPTGRTYNVRSTLHMLDVEVGWEFFWFRRRLALRIAIGYAGVLGSQTRIRREFDVAATQAWNRFTSSMESSLDKTFRKYLHFPTISVGLGYGFF